MANKKKDKKSDDIWDVINGVALGLATLALLSHVGRKYVFTPEVRKKITQRLSEVVPKVEIRSSGNMAGSK